MEFVEQFRMPENAVVRRLLGEITAVVRDGVLKEIEAAKQSGGQTELLLLIDSPGGSSQFGIELYEKLTDACKSGVLSLTTYNIKWTDSSAVCIYCAGQTRCCGHRSRFLLHEAAQPPFGNLRWTPSNIESIVIPQLRKNIAYLREQSGRFADIIASATGKPYEYIAKALAAETKLRCHEAMREGLSNKIGHPELIDLAKYPVYGCSYDDMQYI